MSRGAVREKYVRLTKRWVPDRILVETGTILTVFFFDLDSTKKGNSDEDSAIEEQSDDSREATPDEIGSPSHLKGGLPIQNKFNPKRRSGT